MKNLAEKISASELEVMQVLWEAGDALPLTDIRRTLQSRFDWSDPTVKTLVRRLCEKGAVKQEKREVFYYLLPEPGRIQCLGGGRHGQPAVQGQRPGTGGRAGEGQRPEQRRYRRIKGNVQSGGRLI